MKLLIVFSLIIFSLVEVRSQISYDFGKILPPQGSEVTNIDEIFHGIYSNSEADLKYEVSDSGIYVLSTQYNKISRKTIRENTKYDVKDGYLFGVVANDSIPCFLEGENYYFGIRNRVCLIGKGSSNKLVRSASGVYYINFYENGGYVPAKMVMTLNSLSISYFNYSDNSKLQKKVKKETIIESGNLKIYRLEPTAEEWLSMNLPLFDAPLVFGKD